MLVRAGMLVGLLIGAAAGQALAQSCGSLPIEPVIPSPADIKAKAAADAGTAKHNAFTDIKAWQADLKTYRDCLTSLDGQAKRDMTGLSPQKDADKLKEIKARIADLAHQYDASVDAEERVVNGFHAVQVAYCTRTDVDKSSCPK